MTPKVSFVIPCYNLAHFLPQCVDSILSQTFGDFEIIIMDDCSPDNTPEVARSFRDPRIHYVRNQPNLGHLRNYNKGIAMCRGEYVWLISADDALRVPYVLERYVAALDKNPNAGYACCPVYEVDDRDKQIKEIYAPIGREDKVFPGHEFLRYLLYQSPICPSATMARRTCYEKSSGYPLDLPASGDTYLWCLYALDSDVAYFGEPMVTYLHHEMAMTNRLSDEAMRVLLDDCLAIPLRIRKIADAAGYAAAVKHCEGAFIYHCVDHFESRRMYRGKSYTMTLEDLDRAFDKNPVAPEVRARLVREVLRQAGDQAYWRNGLVDARERYARALKADPWMMKIWMKYALLRSGWLGNSHRAATGAARRLKAS